MCLNPHGQILLWASRRVRVHMHQMSTVWRLMTYTLRTFRCRSRLVFLQKKSSHFQPTIATALSQAPSVASSTWPTEASGPSVSRPHGCQYRGFVRRGQHARGTAVCGSSQRPLPRLASAGTARRFPAAPCHTHGRVGARRRRHSPADTSRRTSTGTRCS